MEGWGITHDPARPSIFYISDSTNTIFECDAEKQFEVLKEHKFYFNDGPVNYINELEFIDGKIWGNVYY